MLGHKGKDTYIHTHIHIDRHTYIHTYLPTGIYDVKMEFGPIPLGHNHWQSILRVVHPIHKQTGETVALFVKSCFEGAESGQVVDAGKVKSREEERGGIV